MSYCFDVVLKYSQICDTSFSKYFLVAFPGSEDFFGVADRLSDLDLNTCEWDF